MRLLRGNSLVLLYLICTLSNIAWAAETKPCPAETKTCCSTDEPTISVCDKVAKYRVSLSMPPPGRLRVIFSRRGSEETQVVEFDPFVLPRVTASVLLTEGTWDINTWSDPIRDPEFKKNYAWSLCPTKTPDQNAGNTKSSESTNLCLCTDLVDNSKSPSALLTIRKDTKLDVAADSKALATAVGSAPALTGRAFGAGATMANELLATVAEVVVQRARGQAVKILKDRLERLVCDQVALPASAATDVSSIYKKFADSVGPAGPYRLLPSTCELIKRTRIEDLLGIGQTLLTRVERDLTTLTVHGMTAALDGLGREAVIKPIAATLLGNILRYFEQTDRGLRQPNAAAAQDLLLSLAAQDFSAVLRDVVLPEESKQVIAGLQVALAIMQRCHQQGCDARMIRHLTENSLKLYKVSVWKTLLPQKAETAQIFNQMLTSSGLERAKQDTLQRKFNEAKKQIDALTAIEDKIEVECLIRKTKKEEQNECYLGIVNSAINADDKDKLATEIINISRKIIHGHSVATPDKCQGTKCQLSIRGYIDKLRNALNAEFWHSEEAKELQKNIIKLEQVPSEVLLPVLTEAKLRESWPDLENFVQRGLTVLSPAKGSSAGEQLAVVVDLLFDVMEKVLSNGASTKVPAPVLRHGRGLLMAAARNDLPSVMTAAAELLPLAFEAGAQDGKKGQLLEHFGRAARLLSAAGAYLSTYASVDQATPAQLQAQQQARKHAIESLIDEATRRSGRGGNWVWSLGASAGLMTGTQWTRATEVQMLSSDPGGSPPGPLSPVQVTTTGWSYYPPQLALPVGLALQRLPGASSKWWLCKDIGLHLQLSALDIAQYVSYNLNSTGLQPSWSSSLALGGQVGMLLGEMQTPVIIGVDARYSPTLFQPSPDLPATSAFRIGGFIGVYVPFIDFN